MAEQTPLRVLVNISDKNKHWEQSWSASEDICPVALEVLEDNHLLKHIRQLKPRLLAKQKWETRAFLVFDISNTFYDPAMGHLLEKNKLPVSIIRLGQTVQAYPANLPTQNQVNRDIARAHNDNGINSLPPYRYGLHLRSTIIPQPTRPIITSLTSCALCSCQQI
jgi:hypothetical protein